MGGNRASGLFMWRVQVAAVAVLFPIALIIYAFSGCDVRRRADEARLPRWVGRPVPRGWKFYEARTDGLFATLLSNATTAKDYYDRACKLGNATGCARLGHMVVVGAYDVISDDAFTRAYGIRTLKKGCDGGDMGACSELADAVDSATAVPVLEKVCAGGDKDGCNKLEKAYLDTDPKRAVELLDKLCNGGDDEHCRELGRAFLAGSEYVEADPARGVALLTKACDHGAWEGCTELASAYLDGTLPADPARASALFAEGCSTTTPTRASSTAIRSSTPTQPRPCKPSRWRAIAATFADAMPSATSTASARPGFRQHRPDAVVLQPRLWVRRHVRLLQARLLRYRR